MANTTISPNMNLPVPVTGVDPGPDWASNVVADMGIIDSHDHSTGKGVQITPSGININADLPLNGNNLTTARSLRLSAQAAPLATASDIGCLYESGVDLYYNDGAGNQVRMTTGGNVNAGAGSIGGLPSGTASVNFAGATYTFQSATNTPATINVGPIVTGAAVASSKTWTIQASNAQASNLTMTLPVVQGTANQTLVNDGSGNLSWSRLGFLPIGSVIATFPNLTGAYTTTNQFTADSYGFVLCQGQTIVDATSPMNGQVVPNINNAIFLQGNILAGGAGGASAVTLITANLPSHTHAFTSTNQMADPNHAHLMSHNHQVLYSDVAGSGGIWGSLTNTAAAATWTTSGHQIFDTVSLSGSGTTAAHMISETAKTYYTSGALNPPQFTLGTAKTNGPDGTIQASGTTNSTGSGTSFSIQPTYISAVYLMRIK